MIEAGSGLWRAPLSRHASPAQRGLALNPALSPSGLPSGLSKPSLLSLLLNNKQVHTKPPFGAPAWGQGGRGVLLCPHSLLQARMPASGPALWGSPLALGRVLGPLTSPETCKPLCSAGSASPKPCSSQVATPQNLTPAVGSASS